MIRPAYPDEFARAKSLLAGHTVPPEANLLVVVKEYPVERIVATIPWWKTVDENELTNLKFNIHSGNSSSFLETELDELFTTLETLAIEEKTSSITADFPLIEEHPFFLKLTARSYIIHQTETFISSPGGEVKSLFLAQKNELPSDWRIEPIRGQVPEILYPLVAKEGSFTPEQFKTYWNGSSRERFEGGLSHLIFAGQDVIGLLLVTLHGSSNLNIRIESISPDYVDQSRFISNVLHQATFQECPEGFPEVITWSHQTQSSYQSGQSQKPRHTLRKNF